MSNLDSRETQGRLHHILPQNQVGSTWTPPDHYFIAILYSLCGYHFFVTTSLFETLSMLYIFAIGIAFSLGCESPPSLLEKTFAWFETNRNTFSERGKLKECRFWYFSIESTQGTSNNVERNSDFCCAEKTLKSWWKLANFIFLSKHEIWINLWPWWWSISLAGWYIQRNKNTAHKKF